MTKTIFFSVGEPSGDQHAARLIAAFQHHAKRKSAKERAFASNPLAGATLNSKAGSIGSNDQGPAAANERIVCRGFGGPAMQQAGCRLDLELTGHAVVGLVEVLPKLRDFFRFADQAESVFAAGGIDAVVLVDFPGFNWHIARRARRYGIPVIYYCPPQLWAWGAWRVAKMRRLVDHVLAVLPVEETFFQSHGIPVTRVGHPFFDAVADQSLDPSVMSDLEADQRRGERIVAILPGSRDHEVRKNFPVMIEAIRRLAAKADARQSPPVRFAVAAYRDSHCIWCREQLKPSDQSLPLDFYVGKTSEIIEAADCAMMVSGSVSLEMMARGTPAAVLYRVGRLMHAVGRRVIRVDSMTLPNLMAPTKIFPEFVSVGNPEPAVGFLVESLTAMLTDEFYMRRIKTELAGLTAKYGSPGASQNAADWLQRRLGLNVSPIKQQTNWKRAA